MPGATCRFFNTSMIMEGSLLNSCFHEVLVRRHSEKQISYTIIVANPYLCIGKQLKNNKMGFVDSLKKLFSTSREVAAVKTTELKEKAADSVESAKEYSKDVVEEVKRQQPMLLKN